MSLLLFWRFVILPEAVRAHFQSLLSKYDSVFEPQLPGYNPSTGPYQAEVNMGPIKPPQRKGRLPQYACNMLVELQGKFDHLEQLGVFQHAPPCVASPSGHKSSSQTWQVPFTKYLWLKSPWTIAALPLSLKGYE